jgi:hypothetical protein
MGMRSYTIEFAVCASDSSAKERDTESGLGNFGFGASYPFFLNPFLAGLTARIGTLVLERTGG